MPLCPYGSTPKTGAPASYWITAADIQSWVGADQYSRLAPWVWNLAEHVVAIPDLCSKDPPQPPPISDGDILLASSNPISAIGLANRLTQFGDWWVWSQQCQCNGNPGVCVDQTVNASLSSNLQYNPNANGYVWPPVHAGISTQGGNNPLPWSGSCTAVQLTLDTVPHVPNFLMNPLYVYDGVGQTLETTAYVGSTVQFNVRQATGQANPYSWWFIITTFDNAQNPNWVFKIHPVNATGPTPTPAPGPSVTNITINPYPKPTCGTLNDVCQIIWNVRNYNNVVNLQNYYLSSPQSYATGASYTVSGSGAQLVAQDTLGVVVQLSALPPGLVATSTDPPRYYDVGYIQFGAADALDGKKWIHSSGDRFIPAFPEVDRVHYNLSQGVTIVITELVPPAPPSP